MNRIQRDTRETAMVCARHLVCLLLACLALPIGAQGPPSPVRVAKLEVQRVQERRRVTGEVRAVHRARIAAEEPGWVSEMLVKEGQSVEAGDLLARLDSRKLDIAFMRAAAESARAGIVVEERQTILERAKADLDALSALSERGAANPKELRDADFEFRVAQTRVEQAEQEQLALAADAGLLKARIEDTEIRAPWSGRVIGKFTEVGQWLSTGSEVVELLSTEELEAWLIVPQRYYGAVAIGKSTIEMRVDATEEPVDSSTYTAIPLVDPRGRTFRVVAELTVNPRIAPGMSITAWIPTGDLVDATLVPRSAILRGEIGPYVFMAVPGEEGQPGTAVPVPISISYSIEDSVVVAASTFPPGAQVVTEGNERLYPMAPIIAMPTDAGASDQ